MNITQIKYTTMALLLTVGGSLAQAAGETTTPRETNAGGTILLLFIFMLVAAGLSLRNWAEMKMLKKELAKGAYPMGAATGPTPVAQGDDVPAVIAAAAAVAVGGRSHAIRSVQPARPAGSNWSQSGRAQIHQSHQIERKF